MAKDCNKLDRDDVPLILIIDDAPEMLQQLAGILQTAGYRTVSAEDGKNGVALAEKYAPNAVLLDLDMPGMDGCAVCRELKSRIPTADVPVVFISGRESSDELIEQCYSAGAYDLFYKPIGKVLLLARLRVLLREEALRDAYRRLATQDFHTGLDNRRQMFLHVTDAILTARRDETESVLLIGDIDGFSAINDRYGYDFADEVMLTFARLIKRLIAPECRVGRVAGDTIALVLKNAGKDRGVALGLRLARTLAAIAFDADSEPKHFSACFGVAAYDGDPPEFDGDLFMHHADLALYEAKMRGRGQVCAFWTLDPNALPSIVASKRHARRLTRTRTNHAYVGVIDSPAIDPEAFSPSAQARLPN